MADPSGSGDGGGRRRDAARPAGPGAALAQLGSSHQRHDERLARLLEVAAQLAGGHGGPADLEELEDAVIWFARSVPRHFGDEDEVVFPALAAARPALAAPLAALTAEHPALLDAHAAVHDAVLGWAGREPPAAGLPGFVARVHDLAGRYRDHARREDELFATLGDLTGVLDEAALARGLAARRGR
ncbi:MAG: hemerythrin domain-containing protein [Kofleriaceae bacterium]|nr:hemerythrin domain-containing protein [Kofleriaceae bacterium]MCL4227815.1 hemerythrin domain-containing protein [Myxococcales bacterium]